MRSKLFLVLSLLIVASMVLAACAPSAAPEEPAAPAEEPAEESAEEPAEEPAAEPAAMGPEMSDPDTYYVVSGAGEQETLDPSWTYETAGGAIQLNIYEGMVWFNREKTDEFVGVLATDWSVSDDGLVWTFNIRDGVTFHEGGTLEPHDVAYSVQRGMLQDRIDGPQWIPLEAFFGLYTVEDLAIGDSGKDFADLSDEELIAACEKVKTAVVADDEAGTVTYNLAAPSPWFLAIMAQTFMGATYDKEWMIENGAWDGTCENWVQWHDPVAEDTILFKQGNGTGPYKLDHWTPGEETVLVTNENYWRAEDDPIWEGGPSGVADIKTVVIKNVTEWGTRQAMFEAGDADFIYVPQQYFAQLEPDYAVVCQAGDETCEETGTGYIQAWVDEPQAAMTPAQFNWNINVEGGNPFAGSGELDGNGIPADFFQDIHVRKAFNYCFDYDAMINDALSGEGIQAQGPIIAGMMGYREGEAPLYSYDPTKCEEEFKLADVDHDGVPAGEDEDDVWETGFYFQMAYNTGNDTRRLSSEILKAGIEAVNPNFSITVVGMPWPVLLNSRRAAKLPIYVGGWLEDFHDPHNWVHPFLHSQGNYGRVINMTQEYAEKYDELIEEAAALSTVDERRPIYEEIQLASQEDAVVVWMYQPVNRSHFQKWIHGFYFNPAYSQAEYSYIYALSKGE
jgi:peptide/nickel transport system substrate-binding protein